MQPFLYRVAQAYYHEFGQSMSDFTFVFANRRTKHFFLQYLSSIASEALFAPRTISISDLFFELSPWQLADNIYQQFALFDCYQNIATSHRSFEEFMFFGNMLLNDFNDIDKSLANASQIFSNIKEIKEIESDLSYLSADQLRIIQSFWKNFHGSDNRMDTVRENFQTVWEQMYPLYTHFREYLSTKGLAYEGMIYREVAERAKTNSLSLESYGKLIFVGLNMLTPAEQLLLDTARDAGLADFYWDYESALLQEPHNRAASNITQNAHRYPSLLSLTPHITATDKYTPNLTLLSIPSAVGQAKQIHPILENLQQEKLLRERYLVPNTAIVLADESLLLPVLYSIPLDIKQVNVTMGYGLVNAPVSALMNHIFDVQRNLRSQNTKTEVYYKFALSVLSHNHIKTIVGSTAQQLRDDIVKNNWIYVDCTAFSQSRILNLIFTPSSSVGEMIDKLKKILILIHQGLSEQTSTEDDNAEEHAGHVKNFDVEKEFVYSYYKAVNSIHHSIKDIKMDIQPQTLFALVRKVISSVSVAFEGEPLSGLQIMGMLETRSLDFENLIILSANEGVFPSKRVVNSFIPYNIRKGFGLPTYEHQDSALSYHFYRLISRAKNIFMMYDTRTNSTNTGEVSRFFYQLKYLYGKHFNIHEQSVVFQIPPLEKNTIEIEKTPQVMAKLQEFLHGGNRSLSASAINVYLSCPVQFYLEVVEELRPTEEVSETIEADTFGSIFHDVMEHLYKPYEGKVVNKPLLLQWAKEDKNLFHLIEMGFNKYHFKGTQHNNSLTGQNLLVAEVIKKYVQQTLYQDAQMAPFVYVKSEQQMKQTYTLPSGKMVNLKGFIDRIDKKDNRIRIVDYKTGLGTLACKSIAELFDSSMEQRPKAIMQVFLYALMYQQDYPNERITPAIYFLRNVFDKNFAYACTIKDDTGNDSFVTDFSMFADEFKSLLDKCIEEIFDPNIPFRQGAAKHYCSWCGTM